MKKSKEIKKNVGSSSVVNKIRALEGAMFCPDCSSENTIVKETIKGVINERLRVCKDCGYVFQTVEKPKLDNFLGKYLEDIDKDEKRARRHGYK